MTTMTFASKYRTGEDALDLRDLERLEHDVRSGLDGMRNAAIALTEIRDRQLYRAAGFDDFTKYCDARLDGKRTRVYQLISAGEVIDNIERHLTASTIVDAAPMILPTKESQVRELAKIESPKDQATIWEAAVAIAKPKPPKAADVKALVEVAKQSLSPDGKMSVMMEDLASSEARGVAREKRLDIVKAAVRIEQACDKARLAGKQAKHVVGTEEGVRYLNQAIASFTAIENPVLIAS